MQYCKTDLIIKDYAPKLMGDGELGGDSIVARSLEAKNWIFNSLSCDF